MQYFENPLIKNLFFISVVFLISGISANSQSKIKLNSNTFGAIEVRHIGPARMSGRVSAIDAVEKDFRIVYVGSAGGGVWKSINAGTTFKSVFDDHIQSIGAIAIDQNHPDTVWVGTGEPWTRNSVSVGEGIYKTTNGGESWKRMGLKNTERIARIVINSNDPDIVFVAALGHLWNANEDRGVYKTIDGGETWEKILYIDENTGCADMARPYHVYGGLQDNGSWTSPSANIGGILNGNWENVGGGDGFYVYPDKEDENILYCQSQGGNINRLYKNTWEVKSIRPQSDENIDKLRFNWNTPVVFSQTSNVMYVGAQYLFRSNDRGDNWERISPDLTTNDPEKQKQKESGGITIDNTGAENHCTIITINESALNNNIIWVGTDDGNIQITKDGGKNWTDVTENIPDLPANTWCSYVCPGNHDQATAYVTFDGHRNGDKNPYVFKTTDFGKTWISLVDDNIPIYCHVIIEDFINSELLFLGTEYGLFVSVDGGGEWSKFTGNLPNVAIRDMVIHPRENDLILATHGRGIMIVDDISPLRYLTTQTIEADVAFLTSRPSIIGSTGYRQEFGGDDEFVGQNPPQAAMITYYLKKRHIFGDMYLEVYDENNELIKTLPAGKRKGINRVALNIRLKPPKLPSTGALRRGAIVGPPLPPGEYTVKIIKGENSYEGKFTLLENPESPHSREDRELQHKTFMKSYDLLEKLAFLEMKVRDISYKVSKIAESDISKSLSKKLKDFAKQFEEIHKTLVASEEEESVEKQLRGKIGDIYLTVNRYMGRPTDSQIKKLDELEKKMEETEKSVNNIIKNELPKINSSVIKAGLEEIKVKTLEEYLKESEK